MSVVLICLLIYDSVDCRDQGMKAAALCFEHSRYCTCSRHDTEQDFICFWGKVLIEEHFQKSLLANYSVWGFYIEGAYTLGEPWNVGEIRRLVTMADEISVRVQLWSDVIEETTSGSKGYRIQ